MSQELTRGRTQIYGWVGIESEDYQNTSTTAAGSNAVRRKRLRETVDVNGSGYIWDRRFAHFTAGLTLSHETSRQDTGQTQSNLTGYRFSSQWFVSSPNPLHVSVSRAKSTVTDPWNPSYDVVTTTAGARWGFDNRYVGRTHVFMDSIKADSVNAVVPRADRNLVYGLDGGRRFVSRPSEDEIPTRFQHNQSDATWGYRHNDWSEDVSGSRQSQDYLFVSDRTQLGAANNLNAGMTYYRRNDGWGLGGGSGGTAMASSYLNVNSQLMMQETESFRHSYNLAVNSNSVGASDSTGYSGSAAIDYMFNENWRAGANAGASSTRASSQGSDGNAFDQSSTTTMAGGMINYNTRLGQYLLRAGYSGNWRSSNTQASGTTSVPGTGTSSMHAVDAGYTRMGSQLFSDALQLRLSKTLGDYSGEERSAYYTVNSLLGEHDALQGIAEYRSYKTETPMLVAVATPGVATTGTGFYQSNSTTNRIELNWIHRFGASATLSATAGRVDSSSAWLNMQSRYGQARVSAMLRGNLQWTALGRVEQVDGYEAVAGRRKSIESDLIYRLGKWQANIRYRQRDWDSRLSPFKERSLFFLLRRDYGFRL